MHVGCCKRVGFSPETAGAEGECNVLCEAVVAAAINPLGDRLVSGGRGGAKQTAARVPPVFVWFGLVLRRIRRPWAKPQRKRNARVRLLRAHPSSTQLLSAGWVASSIVLWHTGRERDMSVRAARETTGYPVGRMRQSRPNQDSLPSPPLVSSLYSSNFSDDSPANIVHGVYLIWKKNN